MSPILSVKNLTKHYPVYGGVWRRRIDAVRALENIDLTIFRGECLGLLGESGCGKTTLGKSLVRMHRPTRGSIRYFDASSGEGVEIAAMSHSQLSRRGIRAKLQMVFQDPTTSLDPRMLVRQIIAEPIRAQVRLSGTDLKARVSELLDQVGLSAAHLLRYPHEFSGGQRQRIAVARAIAGRPDFIVLDEPTSALDVSVQAQILNLLKQLQQELQLTYLFVSHHLLVVKYIAARVAVMYLGRIVEVGPTDMIFSAGRHPYTHALLSAIPRPEFPPVKKRMLLQGDIPSPRTPPAGCRFHTRCPFELPICAKIEPSLETVTQDHRVACHRSAEIPDLVNKIS